jgi:hypothetical protein
MTIILARTVRRCCRWLVVAGLLCGAALLAEERVWTSATGQQIRGELVKFDGQTVWLRLAASGKTQEIPLSMFSDEDRRLLQAGKIRAVGDAGDASTPGGGGNNPAGAAVPGKRTPEQIRAEVARKAAEAAAAKKDGGTPSKLIADGCSSEEAPASVAGSGDEGLLAELRPLRHLLPMPPEDIMALTDAVRTKKQEQVSLAMDGAQAGPADEAQKLRLLKLNKVRLRIVAMMAVADASGTVTRRNVGSLNIWIVDPARKNLVTRALVPFPKLVPS